DHDGARAARVSDYDAGGAPVPAAACANEQAGSAASHHDHPAHRCARDAPDDRSPRGPDRPPEAAAAARGERPAFDRDRAAGGGGGRAAAAGIGGRRVAPFWATVKWWIVRRYGPSSGAIATR